MNLGERTATEEVGQLAGIPATCFDAAPGLTGMSEGHVGMADALLEAGARNVLVSLWAVGDRATELLMGRFYDNLLKPNGNTVPETTEPSALRMARALQEAKHWLRDYGDRKGSTPFADPFYWAPFVLFGGG